MSISVFDLFSIGIGPSSSHTVGPMRAARIFVTGLRDDDLLERVATVRAELFGSLGATGHGHGSDRAVILGLAGEDPETVDLVAAAEVVPTTTASQSLRLLGQRRIVFDPATDLILHRRKSLPGHPNGMRFTVFDDQGTEFRSRDYYSVGGGFVVDTEAVGADRIKADDTALAHPFTTGAELLAQCAKTGLPVSGVMLANELAWRNETEIRAKLEKLWAAMSACVERGIHAEGVLPGGLRVPRRAPGLFRQLDTRETTGDSLSTMDWVNLYALAVNEENAAGGRVVTAPTNGAAGIIPAVLHYYLRFVPGAQPQEAARFLLTAAAIGVIFKLNASISGAEVGCQGEVGSACSMAAGALTELLGGTPAQVENAAEIGMEHNLGLTCDPVGGLVQIPCIERNAMGAVKAINAARLAMRGNGSHVVSLDKVIKTMRETGRDMSTKYKETARGGLAVNVIEC